MSVKETLVQTLTQPTPSGLRLLRHELLQAGMPVEAPVFAVLERFYLFLIELSAKSSSREFSHFASLLDMGAVGGVAMQNLLEREASRDWWVRLLAGGVSESLMVLAARQYVKAWEEELGAGFDAINWYLYGELWQLSTELQPDLPGESRRQLIEQLLAPLSQSDVSATAKAALISRLFQFLIVFHLVLIDAG